MSYPSCTNISPNAKIDESVKISPFVTIEEDVEIGSGTWIGPNACIMNGARIGRGCQIHPGAVVSGIPQDLKFEGEDTKTIIGDNTIIREYVTISRGTKDKWETVIGNNCLLMAYVHVAHDCKIGNNCIFSNTVQIAGHVTIDDYVIISGASAVHQFVKIGAHAFLGGGSMARKDVPPFITAAREPLSYCGVNTTGLKRRGFSQASITEIHEIYRILFSNGLNTAKAIEQIQQEVPNSNEKDLVLDFLTNSDRGIIKGY